MRNAIGLFVTVVGTVAGTSESVADNGSLLIGVGPISRGMGGTAIANPQGGDSAVYVNPGAMLFASRMDFGASLVKTNIDATTSAGMAEGQDGITLLPSIGAVLHPVEKFVMGFSMVGAGGIATDYRGTALHDSPATTDLRFQRMLISQTDFVMGGGLKLMDEKLGIGMSIPITYQSVDLNLNGGGERDGTDRSFGVTIKLGLAYQVGDSLRAGAYFKAPALRSGKFDANDFGKLAPPAEVGVGASLISVQRLVVSTDVRRLFWDAADGYGRSDRLNWRDQMVAAAGLQYGNADQPLANWFILRAGYNYGSNVMRDAYLLEAPALTRHHITAGMSVDIGLSMHMNLGVVFGLKAMRRDSAGREAEMSTMSIDLGMSGIFG